MLHTLTIHNFTLIADAEINFSPQMNVLTGETGAGKSILMDALTLVLGGRAEGRVQREPDQPCEIFASFDLQDRADIQSWLQQHELEKSEECIFRRVFTEEGRSRCYINGKLSPLNQVRELGGLLLNIHGQHEQQFLQRPERQRFLLDQYGEHLKLAHHVKQCYHDWETVNQKITLLTQQDQARAQRLDFLKFQLYELTQLQLTTAELQELEHNQKRLAHIESLVKYFDEACDLCEGDDHQGILPSLNKLKIVIQKISALEPGLKPAAECIDAALTQVQESYHDLERFSEKVSIDPEALEKAELRLRTIHDLARKHRVPAEQLPDLQVQLTQEVEQLEHHDEYLATLTKEAQDLKKDYHVAAETLSQKRQATAKKLIPLVNENLKSLNMPHCLFDIRFESAESTEMNSFGLDQINFLIRPNPGQAFAPLAKIASGGELSRICLSIQAIIAKHHATPTLIFDEIDTGVGGHSADMIGTLLKQLSDNTQVICITHLPQVASKAQHHLLITKSQNADETKTEVKILDKNERIKEIARMVGGAQITTKTKAHAKELLESNV